MKNESFKYNEVNKRLLFDDWLELCGLFYFEKLWVKFN